MVPVHAPSGSQAVQSFGSHGLCVGESRIADRPVAAARASSVDDPPGLSQDGWLQGPDAGSALLAMARSVGIPLPRQATRRLAFGLLEEKKRRKWPSFRPLGGTKDRKA